MVSRLCPKGHIVPTGKRRCPVCERTRHRARAAHNRATYGYAQQKARAALRETLPAYCGYGCGTWLEPEGPWVAAHVVDGRPEYGYLASCRSCNEKAKQRRVTP